MKKLLTLCYIYADGKFLLGMKKRGLGVGNWNGFGGKQELGETLEETAMREVHEESGLRVCITEEDKVAVFMFTFEGSEDELMVHTYLVTEYEGIPLETDEMNPKWFAIKDIPYTEMWETDILWIPKLLDGKKVIGQYNFDKNNRVVDGNIKIVTTIPN